MRVAREHLGGAASRTALLRPRRPRRAPATSPSSSATSRQGAAGSALPDLRALPRRHGGRRAERRPDRDRRRGGGRGHDQGGRALRPARPGAGAALADMPRPRHGLGVVARGRTRLHRPGRPAAGLSASRARSRRCRVPAALTRQSVNACAAQPSGSRSGSKTVTCTPTAPGASRAQQRRQLVERQPARRGGVDRVERAARRRRRAASTGTGGTAHSPRAQRVQVDHADRSTGSVARPRARP